MEFGCTLPHFGPLASALLLRDFCRAAEGWGYDALWTWDHLAIPAQAASELDLGGQPGMRLDPALERLLTPVYESTSVLLHAAALTARIKLGTNVAVLPLRNPVLNARMLATLDLLSGGRLIYGVGVGWLQEEAEAMAMPWDHRGARSDEHIALLRTLWTAEGAAAGFQGRFYRVPPISPGPLPVQKPFPPIIVGGHSKAALRRTGRLSDGWSAGPLPPAELAARFGIAQEAARAAGRDPGALRLYANTDFWVMAQPKGESLPVLAPGGEVALADTEQIIDRARAYRDVGVDHLRIGVGFTTRAEYLEAHRVIAERVMPALR